ncbi:hypothetical protein HHUSO_G10731 [Huso huso]|uniref:Ig-like domain-containing protein n=1 Tax=Huso huso TaxID=61971 RepID=A0ABR0ZQB1_HUSHU
MNVSSWNLQFEIALAVLFLSDYSRATALTILNCSVGGKVQMCCDAFNYTTQITWRKESSLIISYRRNTTHQNVSTERITLVSKYPSILGITDLQLSDKGNYTCEVTSLQGLNTFRWQLIILEASAEKGPEKRYLILATVPSMTVLVFASAFVVICCVRRNCSGLQHREGNQSNNPGNQEVPENADRTARNNSSSYFERLNSVYEEIQ